MSEGRAVARTVDARRHEERRLAIIDAALTVFGARGYDGATTAAICRQARIGSGTLFHYFPTKLAILVAVLEYGTREVRERAATYAGRHDALGVLLEIVGGIADDAQDPRVPGFVRAVAGVMRLPEVAAALGADAAAQRDLLLPWIERCQRSGEARRDLSADRIASWLALLGDGFLDRVSADPGFVAAHEKPLLIETARTFLTHTARGERQGPVTTAATR